VLILRQLPSSPFEGFNVSGLAVGGVYDLVAPLASFLIVAGYAMLEMRLSSRGGPDRFVRSTD
jgi:hypothetical protein